MGPPVSQVLPGGPPIDELSKTLRFFVGVQGRKSSNWKTLDPQSRALASTGTQFLQNLAILKIQKVAKRSPKTDHRGEGNRPYLPPSLWSGGASWYKCVPWWVRDAKKKHGGPPKAKQKPI